MKKYILLFGAFLIYSVGGIFSKTAGFKEMPSWPWLLFTGLYLLMLVIYALVWQMALKRFPLSTAYCSKAVVIVLGMIWGALIFNETIKPRMIIGAAVVIAGVVLIGLEPKKAKKDESSLPKNGGDGNA